MDEPPDPERTSGPTPDDACVTWSELLHADRERIEFADAQEDA